MYIFKNGDKCPCCGSELKGKTEEELLIFSVTVAELGLLAGKPVPETGPEGDNLLGWLIRRTGAPGDGLGAPQ